VECELRLDSGGSVKSPAVDGYDSTMKMLSSWLHRVSIISNTLLSN